MAAKYSTTRILIVLVFNVTVVISLLASAFFYLSTITALIIEDADNRLVAAAAAVKFVAGDAFHDRITDERSVGADEHYKNVIALSGLADKCGIDYVYTMINTPSGMVFTSTNAKKEELEKKTFDQFYKIYGSTSENILKALADGQTYFEEFSDQYGNFRSIIVPCKTPSGKIYIAGADISIASLEAKRVDHILKFIGMQIAMVILSVALSVMVTSSLTRTDMAPPEKR